jgi:hypothetical protein
MENELPNAVKMTAQHVLWLSILATSGLVLMWGVFWIAVARRNESISEILTKPEFFKVVTVMGVVAATVVLSLADRIHGSLTAAILSGIVGYVLGSAVKRPRELAESGRGKKTPPE